LPRFDCDTDYDMAFEEFQNAAIDYLSKNRDTIFDAPVVSAKSAVAKAEPVSYGRDRPFPAPLALKKLLSQPGSNKETMHYELDLKGSELSYRVGDCFAVYPQNQPAEIAAIMDALGMDSDDVVEWRGDVMGIDQALQRACLQQITLDMMRLIAATSGNASRPAAVALNEGGDALEEFRQGHHIIDLLQTHKTSGIGPQTFVSALRKLQPRLYSVASSPTAQPDRVGLVIETLRYEWNDRSVQGVASCWLADRIDESQTVPTYVVKNDDFQFPYDDRPVIMVGPGTGVAPFRGYLAELEARRLSNETWLFFGHQHQAFDYLYRQDLERWFESGVLDRIDFAWSRDQSDKVYVQDRIAEQGAELWRWFERGALVYVCGDAKGMAPGVEAAFAAIAEQHGGKTDGQAWLQQIIAAGRFKTDVY
ncbi:MAG TPA: sulfite reductase [NADPH] flavoprotein alpha-component, partial [Myxococcales bacterium]|nr:sulfite reductase [NADPH] flavoprotein alpha-component [Myxococcales bacterium]